MTKRMVFIFLTALLVGQSSPAGQDPALLDKVKARLEKVKDYRASALMKLDVPFMKVPASRVSVYFQQPDRFLVKQEKGISITPKGGITANLNSFLSSSRYTSVPAGQATVDGAAVQVIKLLPLDDQSNIVLATLYIDPMNYLVKQLTATTRDNGTYEMKLTYGRYLSWALPDKVVILFNARDYQLPKGLAFDYDAGEKKAAPKPGGEQQGRVEISYDSYVINRGEGILPQ